MFVFFKTINGFAMQMYMIKNYARTSKNGTPECVFF